MIYEIHKERSGVFRGGDDVHPMRSESSRVRKVFECETLNLMCYWVICCDVVFPSKGGIEIVEVGKVVDAAFGGGTSEIEKASLGVEYNFWNSVHKTVVKPRSLARPCRLTFAGLQSCSVEIFSNGAFYVCDVIQAVTFDLGALRVRKRFNVPKHAYRV